MNILRTWISRVVVVGLFFQLSAACGKVGEQSKVKIVGGNLVQANHPLSKHVVALMSRSGKTFCTGTLISEEHVLTAAHCVDGMPVAYIGFGVDYFVPAREINVKQLRRVTDGVSHRNFNTPEEALTSRRAYLELENPINDIAIVKFKGGLPEGAEPVSLSTKKGYLERGDRIVFAGFGITSREANDGGTLRFVQSKVDFSSEDVDEIVSGPTFGKAVCSGDSGGPMFTYRKNEDGAIEFTLFGVASRSNCISQAYHTEVASFRAWIDRAIAVMDE